MLMTWIYYLEGTTKGWSFGESQDQEMNIQKEVKFVNAFNTESTFLQAQQGAQGEQVSGEEEAEGEFTQSRVLALCCLHGCMRRCGHEGMKASLLHRASLLRKLSKAFRQLSDRTLMRVRRPSSLVQSIKEGSIGGVVWTCCSYL